MYMVNGEYPELALTEFELEDGDRVVWHYVDDYTSEEDLAAVRRAADISPKDYAKDRLGKIVTVTGKGSVEPKLTFSDLGTDVTFTFVPEENQELVEVLVDGESIGKPENYSYENLTVKSRIKAVFTGTMRFTDVRKKDWFYEDVAYVVENGLFHGTSKTTFSPNAPMTHEQLAAILYRFAQKQGYGTARAADLTGFADYSRISGYALDALHWANAEKLVSGRSETELSPQGQATRAEVAAILHRFAENVAK